MIVIEAENLTKRYGDIEVLHNLTFSIEEKSMVLIIGPNGAGKSTLIKIISGLINKTYGKISVLGEDPWKSDKIARKVSVVLDKPFLPPYVKVRDLINEISEEFNFPIKDAKELLEEFNLSHFLDNKFKELSTGTKQKLQIVFALMKQPEIIIGDELTANMDITSRYEVYNIFMKMREKGLTVLLASHLPAEVLAFATHVLAINNGILRFYGRVSNVIRQDFLEEYYIVVDNIMKATEALKGSIIEIIGNQLKVKGKIDDIVHCLSSKGVKIFYVRNSLLDKSIQGELGWE